MDSIIETLSITVSLVGLLLIPVILFTILYLIKRNGFYINVNCWFCNSWTKVLYTQRNSFCCPFCQQYNGFKEDGGYNKIIEAQYDTSFNKHHKTTEKTEPLSNGLCTYCNNNQQLKVRQLSNFVPLNEKHYDVEVEHFRLQLEKSYKLCKKCDKVLKKTLETQHAWIFGNRIKNLHKKGISLINSNKSVGFGVIFKKPFTVNFIRYCLILISLIVLCQALNVKISYPEFHFQYPLRKYMPDIFVPYTVLFNDWCHIASNTTENLVKSINNRLNLHLIPGLKDTRIIESDILPIMWIGLILEIVLCIWQPKPVLWKANELLSWITLIITSLNPFPVNYFVYINIVQILCSVAIIYSLSRNEPVGKKVCRKKKFIFKKLATEKADSSDTDEEISQETLNSSFCSRKSMSEKSCKCNTEFNVSCGQSQSQKFLFQGMLQSPAHSNDTFNTARSTKSSSVFNTSFRNYSINSSSSNELHRSLDNLHLNNLSFKSQSCASPVFSVKSASRPIISPPKLKNITQNSWTAGGFWKNDVAAFPASTDVTNLSRTSSQSSGFVSSNEPVIPSAYYSLPSSREPSLYGDLEKTSISSEPPYHFKPINSNTCASESRNNFPFNVSQLPKRSAVGASQLYYKADNMFYPIMQNNMLLIQGNDIPRFNFESSFSNLSLKSFNANNNKFPSPVFGEKPVISSLFKNIHGVSTQSHNFRAPHC